MGYIEITNDNYDELCEIAGSRIKWVIDSYALFYPDVFIGDDDRFIKIVRNSKISNKDSGGYKKDAIKRFIKGKFTTAKNYDRKREALIRVVGIFSKFSNIPVDHFLNPDLNGTEFKALFFNLFNKKSRIKEDKTLNILRRIKNDFPYLKNTLDATPLSELKNDFEMLKGCYNTFKYFNPTYGNEGKVSVTRIYIYDIDIKNRVLKCKNSNKISGEWDYEGCIIKAKNKLFVLLECLQGHHFFPEIVSIILNYPQYWNVNEEKFLLYGNFNALSAEAGPCCSRIILKKINDENKLIISGYYFKDEIKGITDFEKIEKWINNNRVDCKVGLIAEKPPFVGYRVEEQDFLDLIDESKANIIHYTKDRLSLDREKSFKLWKLLEDKVLFSEYKFNYNRLIEVLGVEEGYQIIRITTDYELKNSGRKSDLLFSCNLEDFATDIVYDPECEISWTFVPTKKNIDKLPEKSFIVDYVNIDGDEYIPEKIKKSDKRVEFFVKANLKPNYKIHHVFTVKQAAKYCFISDNITKLTYNYKLTLDIKDENIRDVYIKDFLLCEKKINPNKKFSNLNKYHVNGYGWSFPRGGISFSWSMK